ncbi:hypothetical protein CHARACLAT_014142, partial [Characodon lateralis]|nr:hypothetical protein [Characodon lateralis]
MDLLAASINALLAQPVYLDDKDQLLQDLHTRRCFTIRLPTRCGSDFLGWCFYVQIK